MSQEMTSIELQQKIKKVLQHIKRTKLWERATEVSAKLGSKEEKVSSYHTKITYHALVSLGGVMSHVIESGTGQFAQNKTIRVDIGNEPVFKAEVIENPKNHKKECLVKIDDDTTISINYYKAGDWEKELSVAKIKNRRAQGSIGMKKSIERSAGQAEKFKPATKDEIMTAHSLGIKI